MVHATAAGSAAENVSNQYTVYIHACVIMHSMAPWLLFLPAYCSCLPCMDDASPVMMPFGNARMASTPICNLVQHFPIR